jgi:hypothetical protein
MVYPDRGVTAWGLKGKLIDAETQRPMVQKKVIVSNDGKVFSLTTDAMGEFEIAPVYQWYMIGASSSAGVEPPKIPDPVVVSVENYENIHLNVTGIWDSDPQRAKDRSITKVEMKDNFFLLGKILMKRLK